MAALAVACLKITTFPFFDNNISTVHFGCCISFSVCLNAARIFFSESQNVISRAIKRAENSRFIVIIINIVFYFTYLQYLKNMSFFLFLFVYKHQFHSNEHRYADGSLF